MGHEVLLGDPAYFQIKAGANPHTRDFWGRRKRVDQKLASAQWQNLKETLESHGIKVHVLPAVPNLSGLVFPANAGFRFGNRIYLSNLNPARAAEKEHYRQFLTTLGFAVSDLPTSHPFEGEADFFPAGNRYLLTHGRIEQPGRVFRCGFPPYRWVYGFRSDLRVLEDLRSIVSGHEIIPLELVQETHYHGDTALCTFGPRNEFLLAYLEAFSKSAQFTLRQRFGDRLIPLSEADGRGFAANSFQIVARRQGESVPVLLMPDGLTINLYHEIRARGVIPCPVDVSEFLEKGGGAVKCMLLDLGEI